jgi:hypothetical protein
MKKCADDKTIMIMMMMLFAMIVSLHAISFYPLLLSLYSEMCKTIVMKVEHEKLKVENKFGNSSDSDKVGKPSLHVFEDMLKELFLWNEQ